ncbi:MAG TPA: 2Fe-2S iron-sulfur cluster binding domain-containing protein [Firmicutes bacterium]|uniref:Iron hydrogenase small subunit n=1 Tax=Capillibacterium thermochitinicola TaxID=2699427 RepID=A0A8J6I3K3_9FIRM|nr:NADH-dependent [FeFe] hydrogenase, group A6 [Capillibacterium thermochitinicola]MBA2133612.1 iron hydrogenase small subunit [Capillibacterium thermochitinicola]HHW12384.1 2Fe-2S iron-sulfur cluster binding domain-containing protein [Bacillota bacterium]
MVMVSVTVDGQKVEVPKGSTILEAAQKAGIKIPTLCHHEDLKVNAMCRICVVEVVGARTLQTACSQPVTDGMVIITNSPTVRQARKMNLELLLSNHPQDCLNCVRNQRCELQALADQLGVRAQSFPTPKWPEYPKDESTPALVRDPDKCILCRRCVEVCHEVQGVGAIGPANRGMETQILPAGGENLNDVACVLCGQCSLVCPVGAIYEQDHTERVWAALADPEKHVVVQTAPAIRVSIGEEFGLEPARVTTGKLVAALRRLGFDRVFDTDFTADLTIIEEGHELIERLNNGGTLPMITSCSPGWIKYIEHFYPEYLDHLSTCKSPQQMFGALAKTYYAEKAGIDPKNIYVVSIMPCTAKKFECGRPEMSASGYPDVDAVLTTRELGKMLRQAGIDFNQLPEEQFDDPFGITTGAGVIFGASGGVMEAALRTVYEVVTKEPLPSVDFTAVRGIEGIKEAEVDLKGTKVKVAVANGLANARQLMELIKAGKADYQFIEIMCCPGGCIGGGGQPIGTTNAVRKKRIEAIYEADRGLPLRKSHENPAVKTLYEEFLGQPLGEKSHHLLHTHYTKRGKYPVAAVK